MSRSAKYLNHQPLYRQEAEFERMGVAIPRSTMAGWFGELEVLLDPLVNRVIETLIAERLLHADEIPVPVLDPGAGQTATGYLWAYRSGPWSALKAVAFDFAMSRASRASDTLPRSVHRNAGRGRLFGLQQPCSGART